MIRLPTILAADRCRHLTSRPNDDGSPGDCPPYGCLAGYASCAPMESGRQMKACQRFASVTKAATSPTNGKPAATLQPTGKCSHLGELTGTTVSCPSCTGRVELKTFACSNSLASPSGTCVRPTARKEIASVGCCTGCPQYSPILTSATGSVKIDPQPRSDQRDPFNASVVRHDGQLVMAYRTGQGGSHVHVCQLSEELVPGPSKALSLDHPLCRSSREDPRLFIHRDRLHLAFVGVVGDPVNGRGNTHVLCAELSDDLTVRRVWHPRYKDANPTWEKSHSYFSWQRQLFAVYSIRPHVVLHVRDDGEALPFSEHRLEMPWSGGHLRGGASPVLVGDRYWSWFHGSVERGAMTPAGPATTKVYTVGCYTFDAKPPFRPLTITPEPLMWGDQQTMAPAWCAICFPCGAVLDGDRWRVSMGYHDREIHMYQWSHQEVEKKMVPL